MAPKQKHQSIKPATKESARLKKTPPMRKQSGGRITAACGACKTRKTKCSGHPPPCQMCEQLDTPCVIDLTLDMRRRTALQRTIAESRAFQDTLEDVLGILRRNDWSETQDLVAHVQRIDREDQAGDKLQARAYTMHKGESQSRDRQIKQEFHGSVHVGSEEEKTAPPSPTSLKTGLSQKRPLSAHEGDGVRPSVNPSQHGTAGEQVPNALESEYLSLISQLKTVSDWEATRILHNFTTSLVSSDVVPSPNLSVRRTSRPHSNSTTGRLSTLGTSIEPGNPDRTNWHPSLRLINPVFDRPSVQHNRHEMLHDGGSATGKDKAIFTGSSAYGVVSALDTGTTRLSQTVLPDTEVRTMAIPSIEEASDKASREYQTHPAMYEAMQVRSTSRVVELFGDLRALSGGSEQEFHGSLPDYVVQSSATIPGHLIQSRLILEDSPLSKVFTGYRDAARQMIATGIPALDLIDGSDVVVDLFFRARRPTDGFTCSSWASELCKSLGEMDDFVRIGCVFLLTRLMRWMVWPTSQTYTEVPHCQRPTPTQRIVPHIPAIDLHPMPAMRDMLCNNLQDWMTPMMQTGISCNWPLTMHEALETDATTGSVRISTSFAEHVSEAENWSVNSYALSLFPELEGKVRVEDR